MPIKQKGDVKMHVHLSITMITTFESKKLMKYDILNDSNKYYPKINYGTLNQNIIRSLGPLPPGLRDTHFNRSRAGCQLLTSKSVETTLVEFLLIYLTINIHRILKYTFEYMLYGQVFSKKFIKYY